MADQQGALSKFTVKDLITICGFIFIAGGAWFMLKSHDSRIEKLEFSNPALIEYRLDKIEKEVSEVLILVIELSKND